MYLIPVKFWSYYSLYLCYFGIRQGKNIQKTASKVLIKKFQCENVSVQVEYIRNDADLGLKLTDYLEAAAVGQLKDGKNM